MAAVPPWMSALLQGVVLAVGQAETLRDIAHVNREVAHRLELLGEVALEATEDAEGDQEKDDGEEQHGQHEDEVPEVAVLGST